jgi:hypothetical protein
LLVKALTHNFLISTWHSSFLLAQCPSFPETIVEQSLEFLFYTTPWMTASAVKKMMSANKSAKPSVLLFIGSDKHKIIWFYTLKYFLPKIRRRAKFYLLLVLSSNWASHTSFPHWSMEFQNVCNLQCGISGLR